MEGEVRTSEAGRWWRELREDPRGYLVAHPEAALIPLVFVGLTGLWEWGVRAWEVPAFLLPPPSAIATALWRGFTGGVYLENFWTTFLEALLGFGIAAAAGVVLGAVIAQFALVERTVYPYLVALQTLPKIAIAPLIILWFGFGISSKVAIAAMVAFFPVLVNVIVGLKMVDPAKIDLMRSLSASRWQIFVKVKFPNALPFLFAGLDVAIVFAVLGAIVGEFVGSQKGLGNLIVQLNFSMDVAGVFSVLLLLAVMGVALHLVMQWLHRKLVFWAESEQVIGA